MKLSFILLFGLYSLPTFAGERRPLLIGELEIGSELCLEKDIIITYATCNDPTDRKDLRIKRKTKGRVVKSFDNTIFVSFDEACRTGDCAMELLQTGENYSFYRSPELIDYFPEKIRAGFLGQSNPWKVRATTCD